METIEPESTASDLVVPEDEPEEPVQVVPPVVAVVVTNNPGPWLEETLGALASQDYPALGVLVLDNASAEDPTPRIAAAMPRAFVRRRDVDAGFGEAANDALAAVEGATFLLFCHDDVALDANAVSVMVEEAYRSNAAIVGPKVVDHDRPEVLLEVGLAVDHYGVPFSGIEPDEVDQEQHDGVRDVFFVSHAAMLVRADLFQELSGFDPGAFPGADDIDLCWRARLAGARVIVAPAARVRHRQATVVEERPTHASDPGDLGAATRSRVRMLYKSYSALALIWVLPISLFLAMAEAIALLFTRRPRAAAAVFAGWFRAFAHPGELRRARAETQHLRRIDDGDVRDLMIRGSARIRTFVTLRMHAGERFAVVSERTRTRMDEATRQLGRAPAIIAIILGALIVFGSRSLFFGRVPAVGGFQEWPGAAASWSTFSASWRTTMMGAPRAADPIFALMSLLQAAVLGHSGLARSLVVTGALPLGTWGVYRLVRPMAGTALPPVAAAVAYGTNPLPRNSIAHGSLGPLVCFALAPFVLSALGRASAEGVERRTRIHAGFAIVLLIAVMGAVWPPGILVALAIGVAYLLAWPFSNDRPVVLRALGLSAAATFLGALLLAPWSVSLIGADPATRGSLPRAPLSLADTLRFHTGPAGAGFAAWGIIAAATVPLFIATGPRFVWTARAWMLAVVSFTAAWLPGRIWPDGAQLSPDGVLVLAALGLAFAAGIGIAAVLDDLRQFHFGWRQVLAIVAAAGLAVSMLGLAADTISGRFGVPTNDWASTYSWMNEVKKPPGDFRVLFLGDPTVLPADAKVADRTGFALTRNGPGDARDLWAAPESSADRVVARAIVAAQTGATSRLGHLLAPTGVRYVSFLTRPASGGGARGASNPALADALARQLDLTLSRVDPSGVVYENDAWIPMHASVPKDALGVAIEANDASSATLRTDATGVKGVTVSDGATPPIGPGSLLWSEAANAGWNASTKAGTVPRRDAFGWTNAFTLDATAPVHVRYDGGLGFAFARVLQIAAWIAATALWFVTRRRRGQPRDLQVVT
jgi:GT2 family glycosyltransferase